MSAIGANTSGRVDFSVALERCATALHAAGDDGRPLRELQGVAQRLLSASDQYVRSMAFILDAWISDYFYNLAGDIPSARSDRIAEVRGTFLRGPASDGLRNLSSAIGTAAGQETNGLWELISAYLDAINEASRDV